MDVGLVRPRGANAVSSIGANWRIGEFGSRSPAIAALTLEEKS